MKKYFLILFLSILSIGVKGQEKSVKFKYPPVKIPTNVKNELFKYFHEQWDLMGENLPLIVYNITNKKDTDYKDGVYEFFLLGPHAPKMLFINYKGKMRIFGTLFIDKFLADYLEYIKTEKLPVELKLKYLSIIIPYIEKEVKTQKRRYEGK